MTIEEIAKIVATIAAGMLVGYLLAHGIISLPEWVVSTYEEWINHVQTI